MISGDLVSYINYFKFWADAHPDVNFFTFGSVEKGATYAVSQPGFAYPFVWLEQPIIQSLDNDASHFNEIYHTGITVLIHADLDDFDAQIQAYAKSLQILHSLQAKMKKDRKRGELNFDWNQIKKEAVNQLWMDSHYGWRMEIPLELNINPLLVV
ncbi:hypothetical protein BWI97_08645 [Siphonobacter sp. BAB-5405]|uniref:hypothetical protein n=1 Tax=Siphonobacter sp. BAB-5405 TaxID=1864825 RepID=UPI000C804B1C|nr:hypothetical protein [Siphonobacter sp. BAB-5405]PMD97667.1 hypothetical protein BWI97_08645 [Siphonobacter sp. BAB-5405]